MVIYSKAWHEQPTGGAVKVPLPAKTEEEGEVSAAKALKLAPSLVTLSTVASSATLTPTLSWLMDEDGMPCLHKGSVVAEAEAELVPPSMGLHQSTTLTLVMH